MSGSFVGTGTISNLTRLELEQLRKADFFAGGRALTRGDSGTAGETFTGIGNILTEPYSTAPTMTMDDVRLKTPPKTPGTGLGYLTNIWPAVSETVRWYGPSLVVDGTIPNSSLEGSAIGLTQFQVGAGASLGGVVNGDILMITDQTPTSGGISKNKWASAVITSVSGGTTLNLSAINNPTNTVVNQLQISGDQYYWMVLRAGATRLAAIPFSGPAGREQSFFFANPTSTIHTVANPTATQINNARVQGIVPPEFGPDPDTGDLTPLDVNRADAVFPGVGKAGSKLGYRVILYPDNGAGSADLTKPITSFTPAIDSTIASGNDQRFTIDYKAGVVRLSVAPRAGDAFKPTAGTQGVGSGGRLNLYAVFWAFDPTVVKGAAQQLYSIQTTDVQSDDPFSSGRVVYNTGTKSWTITMAPFETQPFGSSANDVRTHLANIISGINNPPVQLVEDSEFESILTSPYTQDIDASSAWMRYPGSPDDSLVVDRTTGVSRLSYIPQTTSLTGAGVQQFIWATVTPSQEFRVNLTYQRDQASAAGGSLAINVAWRTASGGVSFVTVTTIDLQGFDGSQVTFSGVTSAPSNAVKLERVELVILAQYPTAFLPAVYVDSFEVVAVGANSVPTHQPDRSVVPYRQRFLAQGTGYTNDDPVFYSSLSSPKLVLQRADLKTGASDTQVVLENWGPIDVGLGMALSSLPRIQIESNRTYGLSSGYLRTPTIKVFNSGSPYGMSMWAERDLTFTQFEYTDMTHNLNWNESNQRWIRPAGSATNGSLIRYTNDIVKFLAVSGSTNSAVEGPVQSSSITGSLGSYTGGGTQFTLPAGGWNTLQPVPLAGDLLIVSESGSFKKQVRVINSIISNTVLDVTAPFTGSGSTGTVVGWRIEPQANRALYPMPIVAGEKVVFLTSSLLGSEHLITADATVFLVSHSSLVKVFLPDPKNGRKVTIKDSSGNADSAPITIDPSLFGGTVEGVSGSFDLSSSYASVTLIADGFNWWII